MSKKYQTNSVGDFKKIWEDALQKTELKRESWLEPESFSYGDVLKRIEETDKKRRGAWLLYFLGFSFVLILSIFLIPSKDSQDLSKLQNNEQKSTLFGEAYEAASTNAIAGTDFQASVLENNQFVSDASQVSSKTDKNISTGQYEKLDNYSRDEKYNDQQPVKNDIGPDNRFLGPSRVLRSDQDQIISQKDIQEPITGSDIFFRKDLVSSERSLQSNLFVQQNQTVEMFESKKMQFALLPLAQSSFFEIKQQTLLIPRSNVQTQTGLVEVSKRNKAYNLSLLIGINSSSSVLNPNFNFALEPAAFYENARLDNQIGFQIEKNLYNRFNYTVGLSYFNRKLNSGHNSEIVYDISQESGNNQNTLDLTLASPFGFFNSSHVISRNSDVGNQSTVLNADFKSIHSMRELAFNVAMGFELIQTKRFSCAPTLGFSYARLLSIKHELVETNTNHSAFVFSSSSLDNVDGGSKQYYYAMFGGVDLRFLLSDRYQFGFSLVHREGLTPLYLESDYSSFARSNELNILLSYKF